MKQSRFFRILAVAVVLALLMLAIPMTPALAQTVAVTNPISASGPVGTAVTLGCSGFTASQTYTVYFGGVSVSTGNTGVGNFNAIFTVPSRPRGNVAVSVATTPDGNVPLAGGFVITSEVDPSIITGHVGDTVTVDGTGFAASTTVTIYYDSTSVGTKTTNSYGAFDNFTFVVPASREGTHYISGEDSTGYSPDVAFTVSPKITISPTSGAVSDTITVSGDGFDASTTVTIYFDSVTMTTTSTNTSGTITAVTFTVPSTSRGTHTVKAQDTGANYATATFIVAQNITIDPATGPSGTTVTITGNGFGASKTITIKYNNISVATNPATVTSNTTGYFTATFTVPAGMTGTYVVQASDGTNTATANFVSTTDATISQTTSTTAPGYVGMELTITGVGFAASHEITITYESDPVVFTTTSEADGSFSCTFDVPPSLGGAHTIVVTDGTVSKTFDFYMETTPPPTPTLTLPEVDTKLKDNLFEWEAVEDVSPASDPVTYDLQVSIDNTFSSTSLLVNQTGLTTASYTLLDEEKLESTDEEAPYYWRVRAVDAASNASSWSTGSAFTVGWSFEFSGWVVWVTMVVIAGAFFFFGLWWGRRSGGGDYF